MIIIIYEKLYLRIISVQDVKVALDLYALLPKFPNFDFHECFGQYCTDLNELQKIFKSIMLNVTNVYYAT